MTEQAIAFTETSTGPECVLIVHDWNGDHRNYDPAQGLATPFLIVVGDIDPGLNQTAMRATFLTWHPNAELKVITNCGHYPMQECPPYFASVTEAFLKQQSV